MQRATQQTVVAFTTALLLAPLAAPHAAELPSLRRPLHPGAPKGEHAVTSRAFTGIPSLTITTRGRLWAVWYAGITPAEDKNNYVVLATSGDKGHTWKEVLVIDPDGSGPIRAFDPQVWIDPEGKLWVFWSQRSVHETTHMLLGITTNDADSNNPAWSAPRHLTEGIMMNKPLVLSSGEWILPASTYSKGNSVKTVVSTDRGQTWTVRSSVNVPEDVRVPDEPMIVERKDGSLWMLVRTRYGIGQTVSKDKGSSWTPLEPSKIQHTPSRFFLRRLASGSLLLVKHGPIHTKTGRSHLMAFISKDDGLSWSKGLLLDEREWVSYPDGQQASDGTIYIAYDYLRKKRQLILMTSFTEDDILADDYDARIVEVFRRRSVISDGGEIEDSGPNPKPPAGAKEPAP
jgi:predicted neuraminidase